jgi:TonB family protein
MTPASLLHDVAAFSVQVAFVVLVVAGLLRVVRLPARARYVCLRLTLLGCLIVPWTMRSVVVVTDAPAVGEAAPRLAVPAEAAASAWARDPSPVVGQPWQAPDLPWTTLVVAALLAGAAARAIFLAIGFFRLGQLTRRAVPIESAEYAAVQEQLGTAATISEADRLSQPVTFGFRRPVVLLPDSLAAAPAPLRRAVVTHELFHVRRGDWLSLLGEEAVRTALWFHPAIHWLTSSIQLAREEMVDELTVRATGDRRAYMQALLAFADTAGLHGAPAFAHRRQLFHRILSVSKERVMSAPRIVMSVAVLAVAVGAASWYAGSVFPIVRASRIELPAVGVAPIDEGWLIADPQVVTVYARRRGAAGDRDEPNEVTPENPIPRRNRGASPAYPDVAGARPEVVVNTLVRIGRDGAVTNVFDKGCSLHHSNRLLERRETSDGACRRFFEASAGAIRQWRYDPPVRGPLQFTVAVTFRPEADATVAQSPSEWANYIRETQESLRQLSQETSGIAPVSQEDFERNLRAIAEQEQASVEALRQRLRDLSNQLREVERAERIAAEAGQPDRIKLQEQLARINDDLVDLQRALAQTRVQSSDIERAGAELAQAQDALRAARIAEQNARDAEIQRTTREANVRELAERGLIAPSEVQRLLAQQRLLVAPSGRTPIRIRDLPGVKSPTVVKRVNPAHPLVAMQARVSGTVVLEALVDERGRVADARVVRSIPLLDQAALDAARQWEFTPTVVNGETVPVLVMLEMTFALK